MFDVSEIMTTKEEEEKKKRKHKHSNTQFYYYYYHYIQTAPLEVGADKILLNWNTNENR